MGRVGRPSELANMAAFLMSDEVEYINGEVIAIDGAMGIMGNGTFSNMMAYSDDDWRRIREQIQSTNAADRAKRVFETPDGSSSTSAAVNAGLVEVHDGAFELAEGEGVVGAAARPRWIACTTARSSGAPVLPTKSASRLASASASGSSPPPLVSV